MARKSREDGSLDRTAWIGAARGALKKGGVAAVRIEVLARDLKATPGSFYWHFKGREDLLDALISDWEDVNMRTFEAAAQSDASAELRLIDIALGWISEAQFSAAYDAAIRDWARTDPKIARLLRKVDDRRIDILSAMLRDLGFEHGAAFIRARVLYFHQVGYYALDMNESRKTRLDLLSKYSEVILGRGYSPEAEAYLKARKRPARGKTVLPAGRATDVRQA